MQRLLAFGIALALAGCADDAIQDGSVSGTVTQASSTDVTVGDVVATTCTTTAVKGLATQLVEEIQCLRPGSMKRIDGIDGLTLGEAVFPYLQTSAADALATAQQTRGVTIAINSGLRTLPQQFLLYRWYQTKQCGITLAAVPGSSNHESAIAVDVEDHEGWRSAMTDNGFRWLGNSDPVHYDFLGDGAVDIRGLSIQAFQRLWNRNHPEDPIDEDGKYGPQTEKRLTMSPADGFDLGANCDATTTEALPTPPMTSDSTPPQPDADEPPTTSTPTTSTTTKASKSSKTSKSTGAPAGDDDSSDTRDSSPTASAGCSMHGSGGSDRWLMLLGLGAVATMIGRRRAR